MKKTINDLVEFYKKLLDALNLYVTEDGYIKTSSDEDGILLLAGKEGKPLVLPTEEHRNSLVSEVDGKLEVIKIPFNPLIEDAIKGDTLSLEKLHTVCKRRLAHSIYITGKLLLMLAKDKEYQTKTGLDLNQFLAKLNEVKNSAIKNIVDDTVIDNWDKLYKLSLEKPDVFQFVNIYLKRAAKAEDNVKYHRLATINFPIYEEIKETKDDVVLGIKLRNKEKKLFKIIFEYLIPELEESSTIWVGSNDIEAPGFVSLMSLYYKIGTRIQNILKQLKFISEMLYDNGKLNIEILTEEEILLAPTTYKAPAKMIPSDIDLIHKNKIIKTTNASVNPMQNVNLQPIPYISTDAIQQQQQQNMQEQPDDNLSLINKILSNRNPVNYGIQVINRDQQPMYGQPYQQPIQQPIYGQPMYNQPIQQPIYQQPMQQPIYGQPMYNQPIQQPMYGQPIYQQPNTLGIVPVPANFINNSQEYKF